MEEQQSPRRRGSVRKPEGTSTAEVNDFSVMRKKPDERKTHVYLVRKGAGIYLSLPQNSLTIYDEKTSNVRSIRYCPNEPSIFVDEQSQNALREQIVFRNGILAVPHTKPNLVAFMNAHPSNAVNGGNLFYLMDNQKTAEEEVDVEFKIHEAVGMVREKPISDLLPVALYLGIDINQDNMGIKRELVREAKSNPDKFMKMFDNPSVKTRSAIIQASDFQILDSRADGMYWYDTGRLIVSTPAGMDSVDVMTRFCLTEKGAPVYEQIVSQLTGIA